MTTSTINNKRKVAVLGAAGGIGQPLSLLLKLEASSISHLALYDVANLGLSVDLDHIGTLVKVTGHQGESQIQSCLEKAQVVIIPAGVPRKPGMTRDDLFNVNGGIVKKLAYACAQYCPDAHILLISNPVNSTVPIAWEVMKAAGVAVPKVYGVTTLDTVRAKSFIGQLKGIDPASVDVRVIGGHSGPTIVPLLSTVPGVSLSREEVEGLTKRIQYGGDEVVKAKDGAGSATLSMAFAAKQFYQTLIDSLDGKPMTNGYRPIAYVKTDLFEPGYFATEIEIGKLGISKVHPLPTNLSTYEQELLQGAVNDLKKEVKKGIDFARQSA